MKIGITMIIALCSLCSGAFAAGPPVELTSSTDNALIDGVPESFDFKSFNNRVMSETAKKLTSQGVKVLSQPNEEKEKTTAQFKIDYMGHKFRVFMISPGYKVKYNLTVKSPSGVTLCSKNNEMGDSNLLDLANEIAEYLTKNITTPCAED